MDKNDYDNAARWQFEAIERECKSKYERLHAEYIQSVSNLLYERWVKIFRLELKLRKKLARKNAPKLIKVDHDMVLFA